MQTVNVESKVHFHRERAVQGETLHVQVEEQVKCGALPDFEELMLGASQYDKVKGMIAL